MHRCGVVSSEAPGNPSSGRLSHSRAKPYSEVAARAIFLSPGRLDGGVHNATPLSGRVELVEVSGQDNIDAANASSASDAGSQLCLGRRRRNLHSTSAKKCADSMLASSMTKPTKVLNSTGQALVSRAVHGLPPLVQSQ